MTDMTQPTTVDVERVILIPRTAYHRLVEFAPDPRYDDSWVNSGDAARWPTPLRYHDLLCHNRECVDIACRS